MYTTTWPVVLGVGRASPEECVSHAPTSPHTTRGAPMDDDTWKGSLLLRTPTLEQRGCRPLRGFWTNAVGLLESECRWFIIEINRTVWDWLDHTCSKFEGSLVMRLTPTSAGLPVLWVRTPQGDSKKILGSKSKFVSMFSADRSSLVKYRKNCWWIWTDQ